MRTVLWSLAALKDIAAQTDFIADARPEAAQRMADQLRATGGALGQHATGRPGRVAGVYEKSVSGLPYVLAYELRDDKVIILRVIQTARHWAKGQWPG